MKYIILALQLIGIYSYAAPYEVIEPCARKEILKNRSDIPKIRTYLSCNTITAKKIKKIDNLSSRGPGFDFNRANEASFCLAVLNEHRTNSEVVFTGNLSYHLQNKAKIRQDIQASAEYIPASKTYRSLPDLQTGELRPDKDALRIYQEEDLGTFTDVRINRHDRSATLKQRNLSKNYELELKLTCN